MTIDEALEIASGTEKCWIVWNTDTGEILSVEEVQSGAGSGVLEPRIQGLSRFPVPVKSRYLESRNVTRELLERERDNTFRVKARTRILTDWYHAPVEALVRILERGEYSPPMQRDYDSGILVAHLWEAHRDESTEGIRARLRVLVGTPALCEAATRQLEIQLLALAGDHAALRAIWRGERPGRTCFADQFLLMDCFAYLRTTDPEVINDFTNVVERSEMFGPRRDAMLALGKLGPVAGPQAARVIRASIHDSSPELVAVRERVLQRLEGADDWERCGACCYGQVHWPESHGMLACPGCLGLGYLPPVTRPRGD